MLKTRTKRIAALAAVLILSAVCVTAGVTAALAATRITRGTQLFAEEEGSRVKVTGDTALSALAQQTLHDDARGVLLSTTQENAAFRFTQAMSGAFDLEFRVFSTETGVNDMSFLHIAFTDADTGRSFTVYLNRQGMVGGWGYTNVILEGGSDMDGHAFVRGAVAGEDGIHRSNEEWDYRALFHTASFCNTVESGYAQPASIRFDPAAMEVLALTQGEWYCMMDLDKPEHLKAAGFKGSPYTGFSRYTVKVTMSGLKAPGNAASPGNLLIYSVNGQKLAGTRLTNTAGPRLAAKAAHKAVAGYPYILQPPAVYDVMDGALTYTGAPVVTGPDGEAVTVSNNAFTPQQAGAYTVTYPGAGVTDAEGLAAEDVSYTLTALAERPETAIRVTDMADAEIAPGTALHLSKAICEDLLALTEGECLPVRLTVALEGGAVLYESEDAQEGVDLTFPAEGEYLVTYSATDRVGVELKRVYRVSVSGGVPVFTVPAFPRTAARNTELAVPKATAEAGGKQYEAAHVVIFPDGSESSADVIALRQVGRYTIWYSCVKDGETYRHAERFEVITPPESLFENVRGSKVQGNADAPAWAGDWDEKTPYNGVRVTTTGNSPEVRFVNPVNVADNTARDVLFEFIVLPEEVGRYEFNNLVFTLTDAHDPQNYLTIQITQCGARDLEYASLAKAGARGATPKGHNGRNGDLVTSAPYGGANMTTSFYGYPIDRNGVKDKLVHSGKIFYDAAEKKVWVDFRGEQNLVLDLDDPEDVGIGNEWQGFTTGEVYVSVSATEPTAAEGHFMLLNINGLKLSGERLASDIPPTFRVDLAGNSSAPKGQVNTPYPVFHAVANDVVDGELPMITEVFSGYGTPSARAYPVDPDGRFLPDTPGIYTIVYRTDRAVHTENVEVVSALPPLTAAFTGSYETECFVGSRQAVPEWAVSGGSGDFKNTSVTVTRLQNGSALPIAYGRFVPLRQGNYRVLVTATDYLGTEAACAYELRVTYGTEPVTIAEPAVPKAILLGKPYTFPELVAADYFTDKQNPKRVTGSVTVNGEELAEDRVYTPKSAGKLQVVYRAEAPLDPGCFEERSYTVEVLDVPADSYKSAYFYLDPRGDFAVRDTAEFAEYVTLVEGAYLEFANRLMADGLHLSFQIDDAISRYEALEIALTDSENALIFVVLGVCAEEASSGKAAYLTVNGKRAGMLAGSFGDAEKPFSLTYDNGAPAVINGAGAAAKVTTTADGGAFEGFPSGKVLLRFTFRGVTGAAGVQVRSINGQTFNEFKTDNVAPGIKLYGKLPKTAAMGAEVEIPYAFSADVLDPVSTLKVTVLAPDGSKPVDGAEMRRGMTFKVERYGRYTVSFAAEDSRGNKNALRLTMLVNDLIPPKITLAGIVPERGNVGKELALPRATVTDNNDAGLSAYVFVLDPDGAMVPVLDLRYTPVRPGTHRVVYYAKDAGASYVYRSFTLHVE